MASYDKINAQTVQNLNDLSSDAQERLWVKRILRGSESENVFSDNMTGSLGSGKPFIVQDDVTKVDGKEIIITNLAALGGAGTQGEGDRIGKEEKLRIGTFSFKIGRQWYGVGMTDVAKEETVIGSQFDNVVNQLLRKRLGKKKTDDMMKRLVQDTLALAGARNIMRPNNKSSRDQLLSADVVSTPVISKAGLLASSNGASTVKVGKSKAGAPIEQFLFFTNQFATPDLKRESAYLQARQNGSERGDANTLFAGGYTDWDGHGIYEWKVRDHDAFGAVGSALTPRAFLGTAIPGKVANSAFAGPIKGGGGTLAAGITPAPLYFEFFSNAPYTYINGETIAADIATDRYAWILVLSGADAGKVSFINYRVNDGNAITIIKQLGTTVAGVYNTTVGGVVNAAGIVTVTGKTVSGGPYTITENAIAPGALMVEANANGVPFGYSYMLGEGAGMCGHGSLKGRSAMAARTEEHRNHGMDHGIGVETVWGVNTTKRTDGLIPNYVLVEHALNVDGLPVIS